MSVDDIELLTEQIERLKIENGLLRAASEEQRELNGMLREEYNSLKNDYNLMTEEASKSLNNWNKWFDVWAIMLDGSCYNDAYDHYCQSRDVSEIILDHTNLIQYRETKDKLYDVTTSIEEWDCQP